MHERRTQQINGRRVPGRRHRPGRHLRFVSHEEVVQMTSDKPWCSRLLTNNANNVLAVEIARHPQEGLFAVVVIFFPILEEPVVTANGAAERLGRIVHPVNAREHSRTSVSV